MSELISGNIILKDIKRNYYSMPSISVSHETKKVFLTAISMSMKSHPPAYLP